LPLFSLEGGDGVLEKIKIALRISHSKLDGDINDNIAFATQEMLRLGINAAKTITVNEVEVIDPLIYSAIKAYCQAEFTSDPKSKEGYLTSWLYQLDCLRKTSGYRVVV
jgi:hypothetical protein